MAKLSDMLRKAMDDSGLTLYRMAKDAKIVYPIVHGFYHGNRDLRLKTADRLVEYLGLELRPKAPRKGRK